MAAAAAHAPDRAERQRSIDSIGFILAILDGRPGARGGYSAAGAARAAADRQHRVGAVRLFDSVLHQQSVRRGERSFLPRGGVREHLSLSSGGDRAAVSVLSSRVLQWNLLVSVGRRAAGAGYRGVCGRALGCARGDRDPAGGDIFGLGTGASDLAGSKGDRTMKRCWIFLLWVVAATAA